MPLADDMRGGARQPISLSVFLYADANYNASGWRQPEADADAGLCFERWRGYVATLERACIDMLFVADTTSALGVGKFDNFCQTARNFGFEPVTLISALASVTTHIGLAATISTTWSEPYNVARALASLDRISGGRAGWNVVTGRNPEDALNFSRTQHMEHEDRYARAEEFVDVCKGLWDSYADDAFTLDKVSGSFCDPAKARLLNHQGPHFQVRGPLNVPRPIQGHPIIIQAGASDAGKELSARVADCVFTPHASLEDAQAYYADVKTRMAKFGRKPEDLKVLPGVSIYIAPTREEAEAKFDRANAMSSLPYVMDMYSVWMGTDLSAYDPHGPIPLLPANPTQSDPNIFSTAARKADMTLAQAALRFAAAKGHWVLIGSAEEVVDELALWIEQGAADGFNLLPPIVPGSLEDYADLLVPELQRRGLFRRAYSGESLRETLGLRRPARSPQ